MSPLGPSSDALPALPPRSVLRLDKRFMNTPESAAIILTLFVVGVLAAIFTAVYIYLKGSPMRRKKWHKFFCPCVPLSAVGLDGADDPDAKVYNGYGEELVRPPPAAVDKTMWGEVDGSKMTADEAIEMMNRTAAEKGVTVRAEMVVPDSVKAIELAQEVLPVVPGTKVAPDANA